MDITYISVRLFFATSLFFSLRNITNQIVATRTFDDYTDATRKSSCASGHSPCTAAPDGHHILMMKDKKVLTATASMIFTLLPLTIVVQPTIADNYWCHTGGKHVLFAEFNQVLTPMAHHLQMLSDKKVFLKNVPKISDIIRNDRYLQSNIC
jgi:hypothetical protein